MQTLPQNPPAEPHNFCRILGGGGAWTRLLRTASFSSYLRTAPATCGLDRLTGKAFSEKGEVMEQDQTKIVWDFNVHNRNPKTPEKASC